MKFTDEDFPDYYWEMAKAGAYTVIFPFALAFVVLCLPLFALGVVMRWLGADWTKLKKQAFPNRRFELN